MSDFTTKLANVNQAYLPLIEQQTSCAGLTFTPYSRTCVLNAISSINSVLTKAGISWNSEAIDKSNITEILLRIAGLQLNASATPREVYFQTRNVNCGGQWIKQIEMGIEGDGNDALLARFGRDVEEVRQFWAVREGDDFKYPHYVGLDMAPPEWTPKGGGGKIIRVVYPVIRRTAAGGKEDLLVEYHIAERADVLKNLLAHIMQNMMDETFGIAENRHKATAKEKEQIDAKKREIIDKAQALGLDGALDSAELQKYISPAWTEPHSRESMILRKMRNNAIKKIPKDFANGALALMYEEATDETYVAAAREARDQAATIPAAFPDEVDAPEDPALSDKLNAGLIDPVTGEVTEDLPVPVNPVAQEESAKPEKPSKKAGSKRSEIDEIVDDYSPEF